MSEASQTEENKAQTTASQEAAKPAESPATTPTPKKRGRPRKAPVPEGEAPPKRRRGRPRKSETEAKAAAEGATAAGAASPASGGDTPKKKRGRPKKEPGSEGPPKKRGRPRKVSVEGDAKPTDTTPKKRGRPRKNPAASPSPAASSSTSTSAPAAATAAPIAATGETKESDAVHEPRMESRKRRRNASKSPVREQSKKTAESARKKLKFTKADDEDKLDLEHLERYSLHELQDYAREHKINMKLHGDRKANYIHAILLKELSALTQDELKAEAVKRGVDMDQYGNTNKRKMDYIHALIDNRLGNEGEPLWELWKEIYLVGTEWENYDSVFDVDWDFDHLKEALEEGGDLYKAGSKHAVYLFGVTEPQLVKFEEKDRVVPIPAIVAVISSLPPPAELGIKSVQKIEEEFVPMKELKMDWVPYLPKSAWKQDPKRVVPRAFFLKTHQRREGLKDMKEEELVKFNFALPYIFLPRAQEAPKNEDTVVNVVTEVNGKGATFEFDWDMDELNEIAADVLTDNDLDPKKNKDQLEALIKTIKDTVNAEKKRIREEKAAWEAKINGLSEEKKKALAELQIWKYYPQNDYPDVSDNKAAFVNRYYGKADKVL